VRRAGDLDRFCSDVDVQVGLNVVAAEGETFPGTKIRALAESAGMQYGKDGRFHRFTDGGAELFGLANLEPMPFHAETMRTLATQGVTILLDVPRAPAAAATFRAYVEFARQAEHSLGGSLVDDNRKSINQAALDSIAMQLEAIHKTMSARGITPGGPLALRLFS
jgi:FtsZ-interacting cell division protein ZipA